MVKYVSEIDPLELNQGSTITIGSFDGVHSAHRSLIAQLVEGAKARSQRSIVVTFEVHPRMVIEGENCSMKLLTTNSEKGRLLEELGVDLVVLLKFEEIRKLTAQQFYEQILVEKLNMKSIVAGYNNNIGSDRVNAYTFFSSKKELEVLLINPIECRGAKINSTRVRELISSGDVQLANELLTYRYSVECSVVCDENRVVKCDDNKLLPAPSKYYAEIEGFNAIVEVGSECGLIINKIDCDDIIHNKILRIHFLKKE